MASPAPAWRPSASPWLIAISVMLATFMEVLDTSVANVSLPHIAGSLAASNEEALWVLTSYLVSNAIILPATGWFAGRFGRKRFLTVCIVVFTAASVLAGAATSLGMIIVARIVQGAGGGALQPLAQAVLLESFPPERRGVAMAVYGMGVVVAPIVGPTLGGWITDNYSWRWIFYINLPIGALAVLMTQAFVEDPPYLRGGSHRRIDYLGFGLMAVWLATLQIVLDKGQEVDWFATGWLRWFAAVSALALVAFVVRELAADEPIVDLRIVRDRNFAMGLVLITIMGAVLYASIALLPLFLQTLMGYPALQSGLAVSPRGLGALVSMLIVGRLIGRIDGRWLVASGFTLLSVATFLLGRVNLEVERAAEAALKLSFTRITAPEAGRVTRRTIEEGAYVQVGQALMTIVPNDFWVIANFKETQLAKVRAGQPVDIKVDADPGMVLRGRVDSMQTGTGARFSLLPPENATGNYVKVVQRVPVKIVFDELPRDPTLLGPGMSVVPTVKVR